MQDSYVTMLIDFDRFIKQYAYGYRKFMLTNSERPERISSEKRHKYILSDDTSEQDVDDHVVSSMQDLINEQGVEDMKSYNNEEVEDGVEVFDNDDFEDGVEVFDDDDNDYDEAEVEEVVDYDEEDDDYEEVDVEEDDDDYADDEAEEDEANVEEVVDEISSTENKEVFNHIDEFENGEKIDMVQSEETTNIFQSVSDNNEHGPVVNTSIKTSNENTGVIEQAISANEANEQERHTVQYNETEVSKDNGTQQSDKVVDTSNNTTRNINNGVIFTDGMSLIDFLRSNKKIRQLEDVYKYYSAEEVNKVRRNGRFVIKKGKIVL